MEEGLIYALVLAIIAIVLILVVYKFAIEQRDREFREKEKILRPR